MNAKISSVLVMLVFVFNLGLSPTRGNPEQAQVKSVSASDQDAAILVEWMDLLYTRIEKEAVSAPGASRLYAYAGVTAYQSVLGGIANGVSMSSHLNGLPEFPLADNSQEYDWISSANAALSTVIASFFPDTSTETQTAIKLLRTKQITIQQKTMSADVVKRSTEYGDTLGSAIIKWISTDNFTETRTMPWDMPTGDPSLWVPTEPNQKAVEPHWGLIRPLALPTANACEVKHDMPFSTDPKSTFYQQALEVKTTGDHLTQEQKDISRFWVDTPGVTGTPAGHWVLIENQIVPLLKLKLDRAATMYGLVGISLGDAFISAWLTKYEINLVRPVTYIHAFIDPQWHPTWAAPGFPEYPSGHSVVSGAAAEALTDLFGMVAFTDRSALRHNLKERSFTSFGAAASEAGISRLYGGIHYREAIENGLEQGHCVGRYAMTVLSPSTK